MEFCNNLHPKVAFFHLYFIDSLLFHSLTYVKAKPFQWTGFYMITASVMKGLMIISNFAPNSKNTLSTLLTFC